MLLCPSVLPAAFLSSPQLPDNFSRVTLCSGWVQPRLLWSLEFGPHAVGSDWIRRSFTLRCAVQSGAVCPTPLAVGWT